MAYRVSYGDNMTPGMVNMGDQNTLEVETFATEPDALRRARELIEEGEYHAVAICDDSGEMLSGIRLQLRLGFTGE